MVYQTMFLVSFTIVDFVINTQYSLVFRVIFNALLNFKLKCYRFSNSLIALKWRNQHELPISPRFFLLPISPF